MERRVGNIMSAAPSPAITSAPVPGSGTSLQG
jgi:hypothetical protein